MVQLLPDRVPWYIVGPLMGLCVVALYALGNERLGVAGTYLHVTRAVGRRAPADGWRVWMFIGLFAGAAVASLLRGGPAPSAAYGALGAVLPLGTLAGVLFAGGVLIGYGERRAGGCTSGHGISGIASRSPASLVAAATFFATAVGVTLTLHALSGGAL